jgi:hypothetical protein
MLIPGVVWYKVEKKKLDINSLATSSTSVFAQQGLVVTHGNKDIILTRLVISSIFRSHLLPHKPLAEEFTAFL